MQMLRLLEIDCLTLFFPCCILFMAQSIAPDEFRRPSWAVTQASCDGLIVHVTKASNVFFTLDSGVHSRPRLIWRAKAPPVPYL